MKKYITSLLSTILLLFASACHRQELDEPNLFMAHVPIVIDWSESLLNMKRVGNVSLYFYPKDGGEPVVKVSDDLYYNIVQLPIGEYSVLVFNDMIYNVAGMSYLNEESYNHFSVNRVKHGSFEPGFYELCPNEFIVTPHNRMASWRMDHFMVDHSLVQYTRSPAFKGYVAQVRERAATKAPASSVDRIPMPDWSAHITKTSVEELTKLSSIVIQPQTTVINYRVRVKNLNNAMQFKVYMKGSATGTYLAQDVNISSGKDSRNVYDMLVANREYDNPNKGIDGYVNFSLNTFGREDVEEKYELHFIVVLQSGEIKKFDRDITDQMMLDDDRIIKIELVEEHNLLTLPANSEAGFNVDGWGDDIIIYL